MKKTIVYIDGFNFYYGAVRRTSFKWLDFSKLCALVLPAHEIVGIKYFTAEITPRPSDPDQADRQQTYFRALRTIPGLSIYLGHFLQTKVRMPLVSPEVGGPNTVEVWKTEEKGSDVNLAAHLLMDGHAGAYECAAVISNDGDLKMPVEMVRADLGLPVGVLNPHQRRSWALSPRDLPPGSFYKPIRPGPISASLFPVELTDADGTFSCPASWLPGKS